MHWPATAPTTGLAVPVIAALRGGLTGSPAGAGDEDGVYLRAGDVVEVSLADLPALTTTIAAPSELDPSPTQECR